ncbi:MAG TPA: J domain-containing protein, partial [Aggregatilineales bacterium]|nr:J domain-containing protein [Aggregatilineales bacterium]
GHFSAVQYKRANRFFTLGKAQIAMEYKDYYKILGVERTADQKAIQKAYRKLARKHHPDINPGSKEHEETFKEINEAYEVLGDPEKRAKYDQFGMGAQPTGAAGGFDDSGQTPGRTSYTYHTSPDREEMFGNEADFSDFFRGLFGQRSGSGRASGPQRGQDIESPVEITLDEAYRGAARLLNKEGRDIQVRIPPGVRNGSRVKMAGQGTPGRDGGKPGDLYLIVEIAPHERFERKGDDLYVDADVPLSTAILGGRAEVPTLDGSVGLSIPPETQNGRVFRLKGRGMPLIKTPSERGDLFARVKVRLPQHLTEEQRALFEQLHRLEGEQ